jgi:very-short-patch-repair endonuclease
MPHPRAAEAANLFTFLREVQQLRSPSIRSVDTYAGQGGGIWSLVDLPVHPAVSVLTATEATPVDAVFLSIAQVPASTHPAPPPAIASRIVGRLDEPTTTPKLNLDDLAPLALPEDERLRAEAERLNEHREQERGHAEAAFRSWLPSWQAWAEREQADRPVRALYRNLSQIAGMATEASQDWELALGIGRTRWKDFGVDRPVAVWPVEFEVNDRNGALELRVAGPGRAEDDLFPPESNARPAAFTDLRLALDTLADHHPLANDVMEQPLRAFAFTSAIGGKYVDGEDAAAAARAESVPVVEHGPMVIVRRRPRSSSIAALGDIANQLRHAGELPDGILALLDPNLVPQPPRAESPFQGERSGGAFQFADDEIVAALPLNEAQIKVLRRVDQRPLTLVQGPPGTGKTHTTAALVSHLLAQGLRILITAETEQALREVRDKLPDDVRDLSVAVIGSGQSEMSNLSQAVNRINQHTLDFDDRTNAAEQQQLIERISLLRQQIAGLRTRAVDVIEHETRTHQTPEGEDTLAGFVTRLHGWADPLDGLVDDVAAFDRPHPDLAAVANLVRATRTVAETRDHHVPGDLPDESSVPDPVSMADAIRRAVDLKGRTEGPDPRIVARLVDAGPDQRAWFDTVTRTITDGWSWLAARPEPWASEALVAISSRTATTWSHRARHVRELLATAQADRRASGSGVEISASPTDVRTFISLGSDLLQWLSGGEEIKTERSGEVKFGLLTPKEVKSARPFIEGMRVDGREPSTAKAVEQAVAHLRVVDQLVRLREVSVNPPTTNSIDLQLAAYSDESKLLDELDALIQSVERLSTWLGPEVMAIPSLDGTAWPRLRENLDAANARAELASTELTLAGSAGGLRSFPTASAVVAAIDGLDGDAFAEASTALARAAAHRRAIAETERLQLELRILAPKLVDAIHEDPRSTRWDSLPATLPIAWRRASLARFVGERPTDDPTALLARATKLEQEQSEAIASLAASRAWRAAVQRLDPGKRSFLKQYVQLVKGLGKGTGKRADDRRAAIRRALEQCRDAVPVWVMPLYRIATTLPMAQNSFDVVIVDEASQAGLDALMLQFLAPKLVIVGDDKQVSPSMIGVEDAHVAQLATRYLGNSPYVDSFKDKERSLFDEAAMRFGDVVTLVEHRRCMPDIIGFSNEIAYEPDGISLIPIREPGSGALEAVVTHHIRGAVVEGATAKRNQQEAKFIVEQIVDCLADPRYDGKTIGVISMLGKAQADLIDTRLRETVDPAEWKHRALRVGQPPEFQGSERDVIFLSMVASTDDDRRVMALTAKQYVQRYNVAVSRAKDQLWIVHSLDQGRLTNPEDLRRRLLAYALKVQRRPGSGFPGAMGLVSEDDPVMPFDSRFEQRVHNVLVRAGHTVVPQYPASRYTIDLVVVGANRKLAIECDGDHWHRAGKDVASDLRRQRDLERCGWTFVRVRESSFLMDPDAAMRPVFQALAKLGIGGPTIAGPTVPEMATPEPILVIEPPVEDLRPSPVIDGKEPHGRPVDTTPAAGIAEELIDSRVDDGGISLLSDPLPPSAPPSFWPKRSEAPVAETAPGFEPIGGTVPGEALSDSQGGLIIGRTTHRQHGAEDADSRRNDGRHHLARFTAWQGSATLIDAAGASVIEEELVSIVRIEGPVSALRLCQLHRRASGGQRVARSTKTLYLSVVRGAIVNGRLAAAGDATDLDGLWVRIPETPPVVVRERGDRDFWEIPPQEVAALLRRIDDGVPEAEVIERAVRLYEIGRRTSQITTYLTERLREARAT